jgi:HK97 family phage major capsid protein
VFMEETTFTNNAAEVDESVEGTPGTYPEAALATTEQSSPVRKIAVWLPVSDEQLEDVAQVTGYINNRLPFMLRQRLDGQVLNGDGVAPNLDGILNVAGIQTYALAAEPVFDAVHKGITLVNVTGRASADAIAMHSNDWQDLRLTRTADGIYILGNPSEVGIPRLWGLPVVVNETIAENTALVGDFGGYSELSFKRGIDIQVSNSHDTFFIEGKQAFRADVRVALVVYRPAAFCTVTGI